MLWPWCRMRPLSGAKKPVIRLNSVVLPAPLGPMMPTISHSDTATRHVAVRLHAAEADGHLHGLKHGHR